MRVNSSTYLKRFSKILSVTILDPSDNANNVANCGCISVGKPGYGNVLICVGPKRSSIPTTRTASSYSSTVAPISTSFALIASKCFGITFLISTSPFVAAAIHINVPASI